MSLFIYRSFRSEPWAIALGNDTDTTACVAGGLAGLIFGYEGLPKNWLIHLKGQDLVERLIVPLLNR